MELQIRHRKPKLHDHGIFNSPHEPVQQPLFIIGMRLELSTHMHVPKRRPSGVRWWNLLELHSSRFGIDHLSHETEQSRAESSLRKINTRWLHIETFLPRFSRRLTSSHVKREDLEFQPWIYIEFSPNYAFLLVSSHLIIYLSLFSIKYKTFGNIHAALLLKKRISVCNIIVNEEIECWRKLLCLEDDSRSV